MFFEKKGMELIGKSAATLRKQYEPKETPPEIFAWIGYKFTFIVKVLSYKSVNAVDPSFEVVMIKERFGKQPIIQAVSTGPSVPTSSSLATLTEYNDLPLLIPISSKQIEKQVYLLIDTTHNPVNHRDYHKSYILSLFSAFITTRTKY